MKKIFWFDDIIFGDNVIICIGDIFKELEEFIKKEANKKTNYIFKEKKEELEKSVGKNRSLMLFTDDYRLHIIFLENFKNSWYYHNILLHEITHYKQHQFTIREIEGEDEFEAYYIEKTFDNLRKQILSK